MPESAQNNIPKYSKKFFISKMFFMGSFSKLLVALVTRDCSLSWIEVKVCITPCPVCFNISNGGSMALPGFTFNTTEPLPGHAVVINDRSEKRDYVLDCPNSRPSFDNCGTVVIYSCGGLLCLLILALIPIIVWLS